MNRDLCFENPYIALDFSKFPRRPLLLSPSKLLWYYSYSSPNIQRIDDKFRTLCNLSTCICYNYIFQNIWWWVVQNWGEGGYRIPPIGKHYELSAGNRLSAGNSLKISSMSLKITYISGIHIYSEFKEVSCEFK